MASKKVTAETLGAEIQKILKEYEDGIETDLATVTKAVAQKSVVALRNESRAKFKSGHNYKYAKGWTSTTEEGRLKTVVTIYNHTPGLPHLLENGHANRGGGRTPGREHIAPVEQETIQEFTKKVEATI